MYIPSTFSDATSPTKSKQRAENAPFRSPIWEFGTLKILEFDLTNFYRNFVKI